MPIIFPSNRCIDACTSTLQGKLMQSEDQGAGFNPFAKPSHHDRICIYIYIHIHVLWYSRKGNKTKQQPNIILSAIRFLICTITSSACPFPIFKHGVAELLTISTTTWSKWVKSFLKYPLRCPWQCNENHHLLIFTMAPRIPRRFCKHLQRQSVPMSCWCQSSSVLPLSKDT